jgi:hypothetical protein
MASRPDCGNNRGFTGSVHLGRVPVILLVIAAFATPNVAEAVGSLSHSDKPRGAPIPERALRQIVAKYGPFAYVPGSVPSGFMFAGWRSERPAQRTLLTRLHVTFAKSGTKMIWTVSDGRDQGDYADCSSRPYYDSMRRIGSRLVYYAHGNHGDSAWTCFTVPSTSGHRRQGIGIDLWVANQAGRPSPLSAIRVVASARLTPPAVAPTPVAAPLTTATSSTTTTAALPTTTTTPSPPPPPVTTTTPPPSLAGNCAPSYPDFCIPPPPPDLDCKDIPRKRFRVIYNVASPDPHGFDGDHDGIGCET